jgi:hypothetical protein
MINHSNLPAVRDAMLPAKYEAAKTALAECSQIDECKSWADKAAALASYAKQAQDDSLEKYALKVRARAIRRAGELLQQIEPQSGMRTDKPRGDTSPRLETRKSAAEEAGISNDQRKQALRIANVPAKDFEQMVEAEKPATITELADKGKQSKPKPLVDMKGRNPEDFKKATWAIGHFVDAVEFMADADIEAIIRGLDEQEKKTMIQNIKYYGAWLAVIKQKLEASR